MGPVDDLHATRLLESLPARPPTPPREAVNHELDALPKQLTVTLRSLQTPPGFLSPTSSSKDSTTRRKRVGFSSQAQYQEPPIYVDRASRTQQTTPGSRSTSLSRPVKGILKPAATPNRLAPIISQGLEDFVKPGQTHFAEMLESTLQQLAGADRESKIDAYTMLFRGLKASSNLPDRIALQQKLDVFLQFIQRDLSGRPSTGSIDILLLSSAVRLLHTFLRHQGIASSIASEFGAFLVDHCIKSFEEAQTPKEIVRHLMHALFLQNFGPDVMTTERIGRLVKSLHDLESHMTGKSIIQSRIHVFEKLVKQCAQQMAFHSDWLQDLFTDMLSSAAEIRSAAIRLGLDAAFALNVDKRLVSRALDLLNLGLDDKKYVEHISERLKSLLQNTEDCVSVPRIWSVITLLIPKPDSWDYFKPWTLILQSSFNHADIQVRKEANHAWCRFAYRLFLDGRLGTKPMIKLIRHPLLNQLRSKKKTLRDSALGSVRNYLYYACQPNVDLKTMDDVWDLGVAPPIQQLIEHAEEGNANVTEATALLTGLIDCTTRRRWIQSRIADAAWINDEELPAIDPKWIRKNSGRIFELAGPLLQKCFIELSVPGSQSRKLWQAFVASVASASSKDVKLHDDTAKFVAGAFTLLLKVWKKGLSPAMNGSCSQFLNSVRDFILVLVQELGLLPNPFMDKEFIRSTEDKFILHAPASSRRPSKHQSTKRPPLHHLFFMLSHFGRGTPDDDRLVQLFESIFSPFFEKRSAKGQGYLALALLRQLPADTSHPFGPWLMCARKISLSLEDSQDSSGSGSGPCLGPELRDIVKVLERGYRSFPTLPWEHWLQMFHSLLAQVRNETGVAGVAIAVVEPLAAMVNSSISHELAAIPSKSIRAAIELITASTHPRDKLAVDAARRKLWGTSTAGARQASFDPCDNLYKLIVSMLEKLYTRLAPHSSENVIGLLTEVKGFFDRGQPKLVLRALSSTQESVARWIEDKDHRVTRTNSPDVVAAVSKTHHLWSRRSTHKLQMEALWQTLCRALVQVSAAELPLDTIEPLFCAAFNSTHREIVRITAETWNQIYEHVDHIEYPETLRNVLESLGSSVDIVRPGLEIMDDASNMRPSFTESQDYGNHLPDLSLAMFLSTPLSHIATSRRSATPGSAMSAEKRPARQDSAVSAPKKLMGRNSKTKLRHEDSQVQFAAIESSPALAVQESQLLTDRQKEIRERQRETAAMFPALRSSPSAQTKKAQATNAQQPIVPSASCRAATPEPDGGYEDCLASTPTPRRGQSAPLPGQDHEMTDPPSSPPELRSFPLLAALKSQTSKSVPVDDWQFSSSPLSGSPNPNDLTNPLSQATELADVDEQLQLGGEGDVIEISNVPEAAQQDVVSSQVIVIEDTTSDGQVYDADLPVAVRKQAEQSSQITPSGRNLRSKMVQMTPRSDNEEFMDARSSPMPPTPSQRFCAMGSLPGEVPLNTANSDSFNISASFENGLRNVSTARIEVPSRSSQSTPSKKTYEDILPQSPEKPEEAPLAPRGSDPTEHVEVLDTIEVAGAEDKKRGHRRRSKAGDTPVRSTRHTRTPSLSTQDSQGFQAHVHSANAEELVPCGGNFDNLSPGNGKWWRKRKRSVSSSVFSSGGSKKARHEDFLAAESIPEEIPASQPTPDAAAVQYGMDSSAPDVSDLRRQLLTFFTDPPVEMQTAEDLYQAEVSSVVNEEYSLVENTIASQDLSLAAEEEPVEEAHHLPPSCADEEPVQKPQSELQPEPEPELEPQPQPQPEPEPEPELDVLEDVTDYMIDDMTTYSDDEEAVHSQLAREEQESASRPASPGRVMLDSAELSQDVVFAMDDLGEDAAPRQDTAAVENSPPEPTNKFDGLMDMFRGGLDILRATNLTREQVYEVEDLMFVMRTEIHQAERRGRE
ncbi:unnamed protein product [Discula destructiva]